MRLFVECHTASGGRPSPRQDPPAPPGAALVFPSFQGIGTTAPRPRGFRGDQEPPRCADAVIWWKLAEQQHGRGVFTPGTVLGEKRAHGGECTWSVSPRRPRTFQRRQFPAGPPVLSWDRFEVSQSTVHGRHPKPGKASLCVPEDPGPRACQARRGDVFWSFLSVFHSSS